MKTKGYILRFGEYVKLNPSKDYLIEKDKESIEKRKERRELEKKILIIADEIQKRNYST